MNSAQIFLQDQMNLQENTRDIIILETLTSNDIQIV